MPSGTRSSDVSEPACWRSNRQCSPKFFIPEQPRKSRAGSASPLPRQLIFFFPAREDSLPDFLQLFKRGAHYIDILLVTVVHPIPEDIVEFIGVDTAALFHDPKFFVELPGQTKVALHRSFTALEQIDNSGQRTDTGRYASENSGGHAERVRCGLSFPVCLNGIDDLQGRAGDISCGGDDGSSGSPDGIADLIESADNVGQYAVKLRPGSRIGSFLFRLVLFFASCCSALRSLARATAMALPSSGVSLCRFSSSS